jgi:hypothetical protein
LICFEGTYQMVKKNIHHDEICHLPSHNHHLCYLVSQGFDLSDPSEFKGLMSEPTYECGNCGRLAHSNENLCKPVKQ